MNVKLKSMAPWNQVTLNDGFVITKNWQLDDGTHNFKPIAAYVEYEDLPIEVVDYSLMTKAELTVVAKDLGIDISGLTKSQLVEAINGTK